MRRLDIAKIPPDDTLMMPMRDGVKLHTELFFPRAGGGPFPTILIRTPYPDSTFPFSARPIELFRAAGYAVAIQSCRGTWKSQGRFRFFQHEAEDGYDCIEELARRPWSNGKIGMYGSSYLGTVQWLAARLRPPHLTCIAPQSPGGMFFYETPYIGGVLYKNHLLTWPRLVARHSWDEMEFEWASLDIDEHSALYKATLQSPNVDAVKEWHADDPDIAEAMLEVLEHPTLDDWWRNIMLTPESARQIEIPILAITGFYDGDQAGCLYNWQTIEPAAPSSRGRRHLIVGPWRHAQMSTGTSEPMGLVKFGANASVLLPNAVLGFFNAYMQGDPAALEQLPKRCRLYTSGTNCWHEVSEYPPKESVQTPLYFLSAGAANSLRGDGRLVFDPPTGQSAPDRLEADWSSPTPAVSVGEDARVNEARDDVLVYTSTTLDGDLAVLGPVEAVIHLAADVPDCDIIIRIEDVHPDGAAINLTGEFGCGAFRARYRHGFEQEVSLVPGETARLVFHVCHMGHVFQKGHRIRVALTTTVANMLEPNHHTGEPIATAVKRCKATELIYHDASRPSHVILPVFHVRPAQCP